MSIYYVFGVPYSDELWHHGIKGQKWGIRRYQNADGTLTEAGKKRYSPRPIKVVLKPPIDMRNKNSIEYTLNKLKGYHDATMDIAKKINAKSEKIIEKQKSLDKDSKKYLALEDKRRILGRNYVENFLNKIAYLSLIDSVKSEAESRGYKVVAKELKNAKDSFDFYYELSKQN